MNKRYLLLISALVVILASVIGIRHQQARLITGSNTPVNKKLVTANTGFAIRLFKEVTANHPNRNMLLSPCGVSIVLSLTYNGALGDTRKAISTTLGLNGMSKSEINESNLALMDNLENPGAGVKLAMANAAWVSKRAQIIPSFIDTAKEYYNAEATNLNLADPAAASLINKWVHQKTQGQIDNIAEDLDDLTVLCLTNAVYFKGTWTHRFDKEQTQNAPFIIANGSSKNVPMMQQTGNFRYYHANSFDAIALPYGIERISMYIFLPNQSSNLTAFLRNLNAKDWNTWMSSFQKRELCVTLPRWKFECQTYLKKACSRLGMKIAFDPCRSNFRGMCKCDAMNNVYISLLKQKAFIEVNEKGTEATAATLENFRAMSINPEFRVNRPFFYAIRDDKTGEILFMGSIVDPEMNYRERRKQHSTG